MISSLTGHRCGAGRGSNGGGLDGYGSIRHLPGMYLVWGYGGLGDVDGLIGNERLRYGM